MQLIWRIWVYKAVHKDKYAKTEEDKENPVHISYKAFDMI